MHHIDRDNFNLHYFGNILLLQNMLIVRKSPGRLGQECNFVTKASVDEAIPEQQHISQGVLSLANLKHSYSHTLCLQKS